MHGREPRWCIALPHQLEGPIVLGIAEKRRLGLPLDDLLAGGCVLRQDDGRRLGGPGALHITYCGDMNSERNAGACPKSMRLCHIRIPRGFYLVAFKLGSRSSRSPSQSGPVSAGLPANLKITAEFQQHASSVMLYDSMASTK